MQFKSYLLLGGAGLLAAAGTMAAASGQSTTAKKHDNRQQDIGPVPTQAVPPWTADKSAGRQKDIDPVPTQPVPPWTATKSTAPQTDIAPIPGPAPNMWLCEPLLLYDVSGSTLSGDVHRSLTLYNNGRVSLAEVGFGKMPRVLSKVISTDEAAKLQSLLIYQGAFTLTDQEMCWMDCPMHSFTVFTGATNAFSHTFNYWMPVGQYAVLEKTLDEFISKNFPVN